MKVKFCPRLLIFEPLDCTLGIFRGYDFSIFKILLFLDRYFGVFDSDLRASLPGMFSYGVPPWGYCLSILINQIPYLLFSTSYFKSFLSTISIKRVNALIFIDN